MNHEMSLDIALGFAVRNCHVMRCEPTDDSLIEHRARLCGSRIGANNGAR